MAEAKKWPDISMKIAKGKICDFKSFSFSEAIDRGIKISSQMLTWTGSLSLYDVRGLVFSVRKKYEKNMSKYFWQNISQMHGATYIDLTMGKRMVRRKYLCLNIYIMVLHLYLYKSIPSSSSSWAELASISFSLTHPPTPGEVGRL